MFNCTQKKIEMALKAADEIRPIVSLIRTLESAEKTDVLLGESVARSKVDDEILLTAISKISDKEMKEELSKVQQKFSTVFDKQVQESEAQTKQLCIVEEEIAQYLRYTGLFPYVGDEAVATELLKKATAAESTEDEFYACVLLLLNDEANYDESVFSIVTEMAADVSDRFQKHILMNMDELNQNEICRYIRQG